MKHIEQGIFISEDKKSEKEQRICVLTYQILHRKTIDTLVGLRCAGYRNVCVYAVPLHYVKSYHPLIEHRPELYLLNDEIKKDYQNIIAQMGYKCCEIKTYEEIDEADNTIFLICGAGIISQEMIKRYRIINAHPGYLPMVRGLDALKWAIMEHMPIGVTTHLLGDFVDAGEIIERREVPVTFRDTFHTVANRQYQIEIQMLIGAIEKIDQIAMFTDGENYPVHRRMPHQLEEKVYMEFERWYLEKQR